MSFCGSPVENIPLQAEHHSGRRQKVFAFPPETVFAFITECCSDSQRNGVRLHNGIAFAFDRIPQAAAECGRAVELDPRSYIYNHL